MMSSFTVYLIIINTLFWLICYFGIAWLVRLIPLHNYEKRKWFHERPFERSFYKKIRVHKWKDKLPEWGHLLNFQKKYLNKQLSLSYLEKFILETYRAELGHILIALFGIACIFVNPSSQMKMALICSIINFLLQIPFCIIQRYNRPRLFSIKQRFEKTKNVSSVRSVGVNESRDISD